MMASELVPLPPARPQGGGGGGGLRLGRGANFPVYYGRSAERGCWFTFVRGELRRQGGKAEGEGGGGGGKLGLQAFMPCQCVGVRYSVSGI